MLHTTHEGMIWKQICGGHMSLQHEGDGGNVQTIWKQMRGNHILIQMKGMNMMDELYGSFCHLHNSFNELSN